MILGEMGTPKFGIMIPRNNTVTIFDTSPG